jgi:hypothetical protein
MRIFFWVIRSSAMRSYEQRCAIKAILDRLEEPDGIATPFCAPAGPALAWTSIGFSELLLPMERTCGSMCK